MLFIVFYIQNQHPLFTASTEHRFIYKENTSQAKSCINRDLYLTSQDLTLTLSVSVQYKNETSIFTTKPVTPTLIMDIMYNFSHLNNFYFSHLSIWNH